MMKRFYFLGMACALCGVSAVADVLSPEAALSRIGNNQNAFRLKASTAGATPRLLKTLVDAAQAPTIYVFSNPSETGFTILSADDNAMPVLAFSDTDTFDPNNIPDNCRAWLEMYSNEIAAMRQSASNVKASTLNATTPTGHPWGAVEPLVTTKWNQNAPYNNSCPTVGSSDSRAVTGCVATAMAQVMKYHNYPAKGTGSNSYSYTNGYNQMNGVYGTWNGSKYTHNLSCNFSELTFDWDNMLNNYKSSYNDTQANAVATLMYACGASINMAYDLSSSGTGSTYVVNALINYFGYNKGMVEYFREYYDLFTWEHMLLNQLNTYGPVIYSGGTSSGLGHCFVLDGYLHSGYFHFNWGWGGSSDGYYLMTSLAPSAQGIGGSSGAFEQGQAFIGNIRRAQTGDTNTVIMLEDFLRFPDTYSREFNKNEDYYLPFVTRLTNRSNTSVTFKTGLALVPSDGGSTIYVESSSDESVIAHNGTIESIPVTLNLNLSKTYKIYPAYKAKLDGDTYGDWQIPDCYLREAYLIITPTDDKLTITNQASPSLTLDEIIDMPDAVYFGIDYPVKLVLTNHGSEEFYGGVQCGGTNQWSTAFKTDNSPLSYCCILPGETITLDYTIHCEIYSYNTDYFSGDKIRFIFRSSSQQTLNTVDVSSPFYVKYVDKPSLRVSSIVMNSSNLSSVSLKFTLKPEGKWLSAGNLTCKIYPQGQDTNYTSSTISNSYLSCGATREITFSDMTLPTVTRASGDTYVYELKDEYNNQTFYTGSFVAGTSGDYAITCGEPNITSYPTVTDPVVRFTVPVTCTQGEFSNYLNLRLWTGKSISTGLVSHMDTEVVSIPLGETKYVSGALTIPDPEVGTTYYITYSYPKSDGTYYNFTDYYPVTVQEVVLPVSGFAEMTEEAEVVESELFNLSGMKIAIDTPPAGLYIRRERMSDGTIKTTRIALH